jgi:hypothetical protein
MDTRRPPHFDGTNFPYYSAIMACYLEAVDLGVWRVTRDGMKPPKNPENPTTSEEKEIHLNARAKNCLYESLSMDIFNQVFKLKLLMRFGQNCMSFMMTHSMSMSKNIV